MNQFLLQVRQYYEENNRDLPWRLPLDSGVYDPYRILLSEIMLQQTQVTRVAPKYHQFLEHFPTIKDLADASLSDVLRNWNGLGYNRRAKYLHDAAKGLVAKPGWSYDDLVVQKGIGPNTAAAICVYAYNEPHIFIETNIRTVYLHHFFKDLQNVSDKDIIQLLTTSLSELDDGQYREFYWALMDYGTFLKQSVGNNIKRSKHYKKQSTFHGSARQIRGLIIRLLSVRPMTYDELLSQVNDQRLDEILGSLSHEQLIKRQDRNYSLPE